jgi:hypothetical protein
LSKNKGKIMKNTTLNKIILSAMLIGSSLIVSGCSTTSTPAPSVKVGTEFKQTIPKEHIKNAITNAAQENGWEVIVPSSNQKDLLLKKTVGIKQTAQNTRGRIWNKVIVDKEIVANVTIHKNSYEIDLNQQSQQELSNHYGKQTLQKNMKKLEKSIHTELISEVL